MFSQMIGTIAVKLVRQCFLEPSESLSEAYRAACRAVTAPGGSAYSPDGSLKPTIIAMPYGGSTLPELRRFLSQRKKNEH